MEQLQPIFERKSLHEYSGYKGREFEKGIPDRCRLQGVAEFQIPLCERIQPFGNQKKNSAVSLLKYIKYYFINDLEEEGDDALPVVLRGYIGLKPVG
ncbi:MAG: hypothetical protein BWY66_01139 [bacterium ADurb.Bin374]|nr:MAG: hypothetical protein BWY66_01139 [bacterium ADurb.Bin374]